MNEGGTPTEEDIFECIMLMAKDPLRTDTGL